MNEIEQLQQEISAKITRLNELHKSATPTPVPNYSFQTLEGSLTLLDLFAVKTKLFAIHNMGQGCRYCTLWADGINAFLPPWKASFCQMLVCERAMRLS